jgi:hypothetical protein
MDGQSLFNLVLGIAAFFGGWTLNNITRMLNRIDDDIREMPHVYLSKDDYKTDIAEIKGMLGKIFDRLENKADK